jgi:uncharacterized repeat protein (TIGR01451 family)
MKPVKRSVCAAAAALIVAGFFSVRATIPVLAAGTADISLTVSGPTSVNLGEDLIYATAVYNAGPDPATGVTITDQVPGGLAFDPSQSYGASCTQSGQTLTCSLLDGIPVGQQLVPHLAFQATTTGTYTSTWTASADQADSTPADNTASTTTTVNPPVSADMGITLAWNGPPQQPLDGTSFTIQLSIHNSGPDYSTGANVTLSVPTGLTPNFSGCTASASGVTCSQRAGSQPPGTNELGFLSFTATAAGQYVISGTITGDLQDPNASNNSASLAVTVQPAADVGIALGWNGQAQQPYAGQPFDVVLTFTNRGPDPSTGEVATLAVPAGLTPNFDGCTPSGSGQTCTLSFGSQPAGTSELEKLQFTATAAGQYTLSGTASADQADPNPSNNSASLTITTQASADIALAANATPNPSKAGHQVTETVVLTNNGPSPATGVSWTAGWSIAAKGGVDFISFIIGSGSCSLSNQSLACQPGDLNSGGQVVLTIVLQPRSKGTLTLNSNATSAVYDPTTQDNATQTSVVVS